MTTDSWNPELYDRFKKERAQPLYDLISLIQTVPSPLVVDLGCGTGEHTAALHTKLDAKETLGIDSSPKMLASAVKHASDAVHFKLADINTWEPDRKYDVVFSNAALQWCNDHSRLFRTLKSALVTGGQLAVQMPMNFDYTTHVLAKAMSMEERWMSLLGGDSYDKSALMLTPEAYAQLLFDLGFSEQRVYMNVYGHILPSREHVVEWVQGTTLTHFQSRLSREDYLIFLEEYKQRLFQLLPDKQPFFFPFKRLFIWGRV